MAHKIPENITISSNRQVQTLSNTSSDTEAVEKKPPILALTSPQHKKLEAEKEGGRKKEKGVFPYCLARQTWD